MKVPSVEETEAIITALSCSEREAMYLREWYKCERRYESAEHMIWFLFGILSFMLFVSLMIFLQVKGVIPK